MPTPIQAVLFDLDGTLLDSNMQEIFLPEYLRRLSARVAHIMPARPFIARLLAATEAMIANDGRATNAEVFAQAFYPLAGHSRAELEPIFERFYAEDFPQLAGLTQRKPDARRVVQTAFDCGYDVVIATSPVFPETAVRQRLAWAGIEDFPYKLITTYENSRFCKPNPRYFAAIAEFLGRPVEACLMVGDEAMDLAAAMAGMPTFLVPGPTTRLEDTTPEPTYRGDLAAVGDLLLQLRAQTTS